MNGFIFGGIVFIGFFAGFGVFYFFNRISWVKNVWHQISLSTLHDILLYEDLQRSEFIQKSRRSLTLAGFTLSSISLLIGTNQNNLSGISSMVQPLFIAIFLFFLSSKFSIEAQYFWEGLIAEFLEYTGEFCIMFALGAFLVKEPSLHSISWLPHFMNIILGIFSIKAVFDLFYMYRNMKKRDDRKNE